MDLVIMAAGMGSRFGGLKQIEPVDTNGNFIIDYSIYDAIRCGFNRVIFVIKPENYLIFKNTIGKRVENFITIKYAFQTLENIPILTKFPQTRTKPLGTGHALFCAKELISGPFAVINADDFYGRKSFELMHNFLKSNLYSNNSAIVGFKAENTISNNQTVKRGICKTQNKHLLSIVESVIEKKDSLLFSKPIDSNTPYSKLSPDTTVSMNMFGFHSCFMKDLESQFIEFLNNSSHDLNSCEFFLPTAVSNLIFNKKLSTCVISTPSRWLGMTYKEDLEHIKAELFKLSKSGFYPKNLWG